MKPEKSTTSPLPEEGNRTDELLQRPSTSFKSDVQRLVTGAGLAQIIAVVAVPLLARLYPPDAFGVAAAFTSIAAILGALACMRYEQAIVLPDSDRDGANLLAVSLCFSVLISLLTVPVVWLLGSQMSRLLKMPDLVPHLWLIPLTVLLSGIFNALSYWTTRTRHFSLLSVARVSSAISSNAVTLGVGFSGTATAGTMIVGNVAGQAVATSVLCGVTWRSAGRFLATRITWRQMWEGVKRYKRFPTYNSWSALLNVGSWQLPVLMLGFFFSPVVVGFYALGFRILQMPMSLIGTAIGQVFLQRAATAKTPSGLALLVDGIFQRLLNIAVLPTLVLMVVGQDLFVFVFGPAWAEAGLYSQLLAPWALMWFVSSPLSSVYAVLEQQKKETVVQVIIFVTRLLGIGLGGYIGDPRVTILLFSIGGVFSYGYVISLVFKLCALSFVDLLNKNLSMFSVAIIYALPLALLKHLDFGPSSLLSGAAVVVVAYAITHRDKWLSVVRQ